MKHTFIILLTLALSSSAFTQKLKHTPFPTSDLRITNTNVVFNSKTNDILLHISNDTVVIYEPLLIHYIKIGNEFYQLVPHNTTIEKAPQQLLFWDRPIYTIPNDSINRIFSLPNGGTFTPTQLDDNINVLH